jgi:hypothetical protein
MLSRGRHLHIVDGASHFDMYDGAHYVAQATAKLTPLLQQDPLR